MDNHSAPVVSRLTTGAAPGFGPTSGTNGTSGANGSAAPGRANGTAHALPTVLQRTGAGGPATPGFARQPTMPMVAAAPSTLPPPTLVQRVEEAAPPPEPPPAAPAESAPAASTSAPAAAAPAAGAEPSELLAKLYDPLLRRLRADLRIDRERRGALTDLWH
ncbi:hypothetical protein AB0I28_04975 [Phytomonospora sp. NPDC050363]|uniref:hypothetical protein n=1 Tax=Phytomonospora sp. NPDC050363 TaxID=3155642 RepID=UPI003411E803